MNVWIRWKAGGESAPSRRVATVISRPAMPVGVGLGISEVILTTLLNQCKDCLVIGEGPAFDVDDVIHRHPAEVLNEQITDDHVVRCNERVHRSSIGSDEKEAPADLATVRRIEGTSASVLVDGEEAFGVVTRCDGRGEHSEVGDDPTVREHAVVTDDPFRRVRWNLSTQSTGEAGHFFRPRFA